MMGCSITIARDSSSGTEPSLYTSSCQVTNQGDLFPHCFRRALLHRVLAAIALNAHGRSCKLEGRGTS